MHQVVGVVRSIFQRAVVYAEDFCDRANIKCPVPLEYIVLCLVGVEPICLPVKSVPFFFKYFFYDGGIFRFKDSVRVLYARWLACFGQFPAEQIGMEFI